MENKLKLKIDEDKENKIKQVTYYDLDENKCYCFKCFKESRIEELKIDPQNKNLLLPPDCGHYKNGFRILRIINGKWNAKTTKLIVKEENLNKKICRICGNFMDEELELNKCKTEIEKEIVLKNSFHIDCFKRIENCSFDKKESQKTIFYHKCRECGFEELTLGNIWTCKNCDCGVNRNYNHTCPECGFTEINKSPNWTCSKCGYSNFVIGLKHHHCDNCGYEEDSITPANSCTCPKCNKTKVSYKHICPECGKEKDTNGYYWNCECGYANGRKIEYKNCEKCNDITPHNHSNECLVCKKEYVWCEHCQKWETANFNKKLGHWKYYKDITKNWMEENSNIVRQMEKNIINFNILLKHKSICGIYCWYINNVAIYVGQSSDILSRSYDHIMEMFCNPEYWYNVVDHLDKNNIKIEIFECDPENLDILEIKKINELKPDSQKCDGTDRIKPINERKFKIIT